MPLPQCEGPSGLRGALSVLGEERLPAVCAAGAGLGLVSFSYLRCSVCNKRPKAKVCGPRGFAIGEAVCVHVCVCVKVGCMKASPHMSCCIREGMDLTGFPSNPLFLPK